MNNTKRKAHPSDEVTPEAAICILEIMATDMVGALGELKVSDPMYDVLAQRVAAIDEAQRALKKQMKGGQHD